MAYLSRLPWQVLLTLILKYAFHKVEGMQQARKLPNLLVKLYNSCRYTASPIQILVFATKSFSTQIRRKFNGLFNKVTMVPGQVLLTLILKYAFHKVEGMQQARKLPNLLVRLYNSCRYQYQYTKFSTASPIQNQICFKLISN